MCHSLEQTLAFHCAPAMMGLKPANLVCCDPSLYPEMDAQLKELEQALAHRQIQFYPVCRCARRTMLLVYRRHILERHLEDPQTLLYLTREGYPSGNLDAVLSHLAQKLDSTDAFPHEMGILLGYPPEDVEGFRRERGKNSKFTGYWKVYGDEARARALFAQFTRCRETVCARLEQGMTLTQLFCTA